MEVCEAYVVFYIPSSDWMTLWVEDVNDDGDDGDDDEDDDDDEYGV